MTDVTQAPGWMVAVVAEGLQRLMVLRLEGAPPADAVQGLVLAWVDALLVRPLRWDEARDAPRIRQAFRVLAASCRRWPAPADLELPPLPEAAVLPPPAMTEEERARVREMLAALRARLSV